MEYQMKMEQPTARLLREYERLAHRLTTHEDDVLEQLIDLDRRLTTAIAKNHDAQAKRRRRQQHDKAARDELLAAARLQRAEARLQAAEERARSLAREPARPHLDVAETLRYAQRASLSNMAPIGERAFAEFAKAGFRNGWGAPAPQQHMLPRDFCETPPESAAST